MKVPFMEQDGLRALQVRVGFDHSLVLCEDLATKTRKLYSIG
jgi:hypothetical protein